MKATKITRRSLAAEAADCWLAQYGEDGGGYGSDKAEVLHALRALGPRPAAAAVDRVIGNKWWTKVPECDACGSENNRFVIRMGQEPGYESSTVDVCGRCLAEASALATGATP